jgi:hypothetical protein
MGGEPGTFSYAEIVGKIKIRQISGQVKKI